MERFELTIVAQGPDLIWIALVVVALLCGTALGMTYLFCQRYRFASRKNALDAGASRVDFEQYH